MPQKKGQTGNPNGRPKGSPNKMTAETRQFVSELIHGNRAKIKKSLKELEKADPFKYLTIIERLMSYAIPKMSEVDVKAQVEAEYSELKKLLNDCPEEVLDTILEHVTNLQNRNRDGIQ